MCRRIEGRLRELGLADAAAYRSFLEGNRSEWALLDPLCRVTISRFYRDGDVFRFLEQEVLVRLCRAVLDEAAGELRCWSIGCASGEEPYTLAILWDLAASRLFPSLKLSITATDADAGMIARARAGCYAAGSLLGLPRDWKAGAFVREQGGFCIKPGERGKITFLEQDVRVAEPEGLFHLVLCRNVAFTYFDQELQKEILDRLHNKLHPQGALVVGIHEALPPGHHGFQPWPGCRAVYRKV